MSDGVNAEAGGLSCWPGGTGWTGCSAGGTSEVYFAYDERLDRRVAIKVLRGPGPAPRIAPDSPEAAEILDAQDRDRRRFLREIRVTARLEHPGTPAVYDTGVETRPDGTSRVSLVMRRRASRTGRSLSSVTTSRTRIPG